LEIGGIDPRIFYLGTDADEWLASRLDRFTPRESPLVPVA